MATASTKSSADLLRRHLLILAGASLLSLCGYLVTSALTFRVGFPLDDSWIHLTYARNLALRGEWAFLPGVPSGGSTAPLWSALLALGFKLGLAPYLWPYLLGGLTLFALACLAELTARRFDFYRPRLPLVGLFFALEWHFVWASASGMETLLYCLLATFILTSLARPSPRPLTLGLLTALTIWVRPDALTLLGPTILILALTPSRAANLTRFFVGFGFLFGLYVLFNLKLSGHPFPNTFYAKQAEYIAWQAKPLLEKLGLTLLQILTGPAFVLLPGFFIWLTKSIRQRDWPTLAALAWFAGYVTIYALRLPPYQHGRYLMPVMPVFLLWGLLGMAYALRDVSARPESRVARSVRVTRLAWGAVLVAVTVLFWGVGARSYGQDVAFIESEMVDVAKWVNDNLPPDAVVAAHDIGALGYFDHHQLIDMAGLVSPEVIPFLRDEATMASYLDSSGADYFIAFPGLYPSLVARSEFVFATGATFAANLGGEGLAVYRWILP